MEVGGTSAAAGARPLTPEEEARRRNTDCIFFLDPLLTCKKGNECDFRHSEGARKNRTDCRYWLNGNCLNPKCSFRHPGNECDFRHSEGAWKNRTDCRYWLNGNCLNPKCSFRHPPIDGMLGAPTPEIPAVSSHYAAYNLGKQMVPCRYFQKGNCLKGDRCSFYHGPQSAGNNPPEQVAKVFSFPLEQPPTQKNDLLGTKESAQPNNSIPQGGPIIDGRSKMTVDWLTTNSAKTASAVTPAEPASNAVKSWPKSEKVQNSMPAVKKSFTTSSAEDHPECYQNHIPVESDPMQDWNQNCQVPPTDDLPQNSREADEFLGESSPGFDVLVDNDADAAAYLPDEEDFGRDMYPVDDYEYAPADFDIRAHHDRERFNGMGEKGQIGQMSDGYDRKRRRTSSERNMDRPFHSERRFLQRERDPVEMDGSSSQKSSNYVKFHCTYCGRDGHLHEFCFRRVKKEKKERLNALRQKRATSFVVPRTNSKVRFLENFYDDFKSVPRAGLGYNSNNSRSALSAFQGAIRQASFWHSDRSRTYVSGSSFGAPVHRVSQYWIPKSYFTNPITV